MTYYIVCYEIPEKPKANEKYQTILEAITAPKRSEDYQPIYDKLNKIGGHIVTSTYIVDFDGKAPDLIEHLISGMSQDLKSRIKLVVSELHSNCKYFPYQPSD